MKYTVELFKTGRGSYPVRDFIGQQSKQTISKILHVITLLEISGPFLRMPYSKKINNNLFELRISGKEAVRIFYSHKNTVFYLIHAFKKKTQQTPTKEIEIALDRLKQLV